MAERKLFQSIGRPPFLNGYGSFANGDTPTVVGRVPLRVRFRNEQHNYHDGHNLQFTVYKVQEKSEPISHYKVLVTCGDSYSVIDQPRLRDAKNFIEGQNGNEKHVFVGTIDSFSDIFTRTTYWSLNNQEIIELIR